MSGAESLWPLLEIDVGNTRLKWRLRDSARVLDRGALLRAGCADAAAQVLELNRQMGEVRPARIWVASVAAAELDAALQQWGARKFAVSVEFARVTSASVGIQVGYRDPARLGVDRWLAVLAASRLNLDGVMIVDCGSAVTIDILAGQQHLGGYIAPGLRLMNNALFSDTARVRVTEIVPSSGEPGRSTEAAVSAGVQLMLLGLVGQVLQRLQDEGWSRPDFRARLLLTGGDAALLLSLLDSAGFSTGIEISQVDELVLDGLPLAQRGPWLPGDEHRKTTVDRQQ